MPVGFEVELQGLILGRASANVWDFGDGVLASNRLCTTHSWSVPGTYPVVLTAYNDSNPGGVSATVTVHVVTQPIHYVSLDSHAPSAPYSSWETAATNIQDAVDTASMPGALVLVSNGVYQTGGSAVYGAMTNRVAVTKLLTVQSLNGPDVTIIEGYQVPDMTNGDGAVRCVYLTKRAVLSGFTLTKGATLASGDSMYEQSGGGVWCASGASLTNCIITGNSAYNSGGGAYRGKLNHCTLRGNFADFGGGAYDCVLDHCTITDNSAISYGGGAYEATLNNCTLTGNSAWSGGGANYGTFNNCTLVGNSAFAIGGGAAYGTLNNCTLAGNSASDGGGAYECVLNNCTLTGNSAWSGGGSQWRHAQQLHRLLQ